MNKLWVVYMVECNDGSLYTGVTTDISRRVQAHNSGRGAKYTRSRRPVAVAYVSDGTTHGDALREERRMKSLTRKQKLEIINDNPPGGLNGN